jgi:ornithine cyclodeaminase/alanine dehydrogenase-like protein (mu-crystallin family)
MELRVLTADEVRRSLPMAKAIASMKEAFVQFSTGQADVPLRSRLEVAAHDGVTLVMPSYLRQTNDMAVKIVSVFPRNVERGRPTIHALVVAVDATTGAPLALLEGAALTAIRTGAASGAATDALARKDAHTAAIFGSGVQARTQLEAICTVRAIERIWIYSLDGDGARRMRDELAGRSPVPSDIRLADSPTQAVEGADVICTATTSSTPVFPAVALRPGAHINAIGSFLPTMQEIDPAVLKMAKIVVDSRLAAVAESGDLILPIQQGLLTPDDIYIELGEVLAGTEPGRATDDEITLFKSVGLAVQDAVAARAALEGAQALGLGTTVTL